MGFFERLTFNWISGLVIKARKGQIEEKELPLPNRQKVESSYAVFERFFNEEVELQKLGGRPSLLRALRRSYGAELIIAGVFKLFWSIFVITGAFFFIRSILLHVDQYKETVYSSDRNGRLLMAFFFIDAWLVGLSLQRMGDICMRVGLRARAALTTAVSKKAFMMATASNECRGEIVQLVSSDINRVYMGIQQIHYLWTAPIEAIAIVSLVASQVKVYVIPGAIILICVVPLQYFFGWLTSKNKIANSSNVNQRVALVQEVLPAIKTVKYYCWEKFFTRRLAEYRRAERKFQWRALWITTVNISIVFIVPPLNAFTIFTTYVFANKRLTAAIAFPALSLFNIMRFPLVVLPKAIRTMSEMLGSLDKLQEYLLQPHDHHEAPSGTRSGIHMADVSLGYPESPFTLHIPELSVLPGEVLAVVGQVGSGKSSVINACLGHMEVRHGNLEVGGTMGYVPQQAWLQNLTLRDNITFGYTYTPDLYNSIVEACALKMDFEILHSGDLSMAGLRGVNLSGGQRQRVNLARCAYANPEVVLLDSPLSAVDYHTAHHLFDYCIRGLMAQKAVLLVTHQPEIVSKCEKMLVLEDGKVLYYGPTTEEALTQHVAGYSAIDSDVIVDDSLTVPGILTAAVKPDPQKRRSLQTSQKNALKIPVVTSQVLEREKRDARVRENMNMWRSMAHFWKDGGFWLGIISVICFLVSMVARQASDLSIRMWTSDQQELYSDPVESEPPSASLFYSGIYFVCTFMFWLLVIARGFAICRWTMKAANFYFRAYTLRVFNAPLAYFFNNPVGDLLNVFTADQAVIDELMPEALHYLAIYSVILLFTVFTVAAVIYEFFALAFALFAVSFFMLYLYLPATTQLKRMVSHNSGNLVGLVTEALDGLPVIQAFHKQAYFISECINRCDTFNASVFNAESLNLWLSFYCDFFGALLVLGVASFAVFLKDSYPQATIGLAFSNTIQMLVFYTWVVRFLGDTISYWGSVEAAVELSKHTPVEDPDSFNNGDGHLVTSGKASTTVVARTQEPNLTLRNGEVTVKHSVKDSSMKRKASAHSRQGTADEWPMTGTLEFHNVWMRYRYDAGWALKGTTFQLKHCEKVGVVGRTGSGKSTLLLALYGMFPLGAGHITLDGIDTQSLPPEQLRKALSVIPQEPLMFSGSVRDNLDPYGERNDYELWTALHQVGLKQYVVKMPGKLHAHLDGGDGSWSLGQKQLICLARAALSRSPVLCLDEATAALDPKTEEHVLGIIAEQFKDRTTLTIAHRLDTIINSDTVMVMEKGTLCEMERPSVLLEDRTSMFSVLVDKLGPTMAASLRQLARQHAIDTQASQGFVDEGLASQ